jgi:hypothetical protein
MERESERKGERARKKEREEERKRERKKERDIERTFILITRGSSKPCASLSFTRLITDWTFDSWFNFFVRVMAINTDLIFLITAIRVKSQDTVVISPYL